MIPLAERLNWAVQVPLTARLSAIVTEWFGVELTPALLPARALPAATAAMAARASRTKRRFFISVSFLDDLKLTQPPLKALRVHAMNVPRRRWHRPDQFRSFAAREDVDHNPVTHQVRAAPTPRPCSGMTPEGGFLGAVEGFAAGCEKPVGDSL
jgi:hypothetical protein